MTKICPKCKQTLDEEDFNWKYKSVKRAVYCRGCSREYIKNHYDNNLKYYVDKALKRNGAVQSQYHNFIGKYFETHPCIDCGENDILVLEFDHRERKSKVRDVSGLMRMGVKIDFLIEEISKCDVRCSNCHKRKTAIEDNNWRVRYLANSIIK